MALGALGVIAIAAFVSTLFSRELLQKSVVISSGEMVKLEPIQPQQSPIGAVRIDVIAQLPDNSWSTFEVQILDSQGDLLASAIKQAWRESGIWREEGETGTWSEQDLEGRFDIRRATLDTPIVVSIAVLEQGATSGQSLDKPVTFRVTILDGAIDQRFLWSGVVGVLMLTALAAIAVKSTGQLVISESVNDSDLGGRGVLGGSDTLVRVIIKVIGDETSPWRLNSELSIKDGDGEVIYRNQLPIEFIPFRQENRSMIGYGILDLILEPAQSYGFYVEIYPDATVDWTYLKVKQGVRTLHPTKITHIKCSAG